MWACMHTHTAWASVLLFGMKGNTRALMSGTAIVQSRFFCCVKSGTPSQTTDFLLYLLTLCYLIKTENAENPQKSRH